MWVLMAITGMVLLDRLRQHREPAAGARDRAPERNGRAPGDRGGPRTRIIRQLMVESLVLSAMGAVGRAGAGLLGGSGADGAYLGRERRD